MAMMAVMIVTLTIDVDHDNDNIMDDGDHYDDDGDTDVAFTYFVCVSTVFALKIRHSNFCQGKKICSSVL